MFRQTAARLSKTAFATRPASRSRSRRPGTTTTTTARAVLLGFGAPLPAGVSPGHPATATVAIIDGGRVVVGLAQVGIGVAAVLRAGHRLTFRVRQSLATRRGSGSVRPPEYGAYSDIPAAEGGTSNPYTPSAGDLGMWLKAKVTYDARLPARARLRRRPRCSRCCRKRSCPTRASLTSTKLAYFFRSSRRDSHNAPVRAGLHDRTGHQRLPAEGGTPLAAWSRVPDTTVAGTWAVHADDAGKPAAEPLSAARANPGRGHPSWTLHVPGVHPSRRRASRSRHQVLGCHLADEPNGWPRDRHLYLERMDRQPWRRGWPRLRWTRAARTAGRWTSTALAHYWDNPDETKDDDRRPPPSCSRGRPLQELWKLTAGLCCAWRCGSPRRSRCSSPRIRTPSPRAGRSP